ncbi:MAG: Modulator of FtsH protease HflC [Syntrophorhabdus sp. PtaU1.Bin002]|nr:MAG: Modulator of FtsH protease HflC [Syntrophorhabdus sp. PtaB.Bin006]OPY70541.1 MAG: Modulator of FtsH protease HflC [Syntrophorhabdus sp. PtaU1.Bin002]
MDTEVAKLVKEKAGGAKIIRIIAGLIALFMLLIFFNPFVIVGAGERGVVLNFGAVQPAVFGEGLHFRIPLVQRIMKMDVRVQKSQTDAESVSKDLQDTHSTIAVNYHILPDKANWIYQNLGREYKERIIDPAVQEVVKAVTARYTAVELITQREKVRVEIKELLKQRLIGYTILVDDFSIINFRFSQQFTQAIEAKQTAEQYALKAQRDLERIKIEAEQKVTQAKAEAEALRLQKANISAELVKLRQIEASLKAIEKWDGHMPKVTSGSVPFIDVKSLEQQR